MTITINDLFKKVFSQDIINQVWAKGIIIPGIDPNYVRKDICGATIFKSEYGNIDSKYGWEVDHIKPTSNHGTDDLFNLQPLQWENNRAKGDGPLKCVVRS